LLITLPTESRGKTIDISLLDWAYKSSTCDVMYRRQRPFWPPPPLLSLHRRAALSSNSNGTRSVYRENPKRSLLCDMSVGKTGFKNTYPSKFVRKYDFRGKQWHIGKRKKKQTPFFKNNLTCWFPTLPNKLYHKSHGDACMYFCGYTACVLWNKFSWWVPSINIIISWDSLF
jgi:hypothetical protein